MFSSVGTLSRTNWATSRAVSSLVIRIFRHGNPNVLSALTRAGSTASRRNAAARASSYQRDDDDDQPTGNDFPPQRPHRKKHDHPNGSVFTSTAVANQMGQGRTGASFDGPGDFRGRQSDRRSRLHEDEVTSGEGNRPKVRTAIEVVRAIRREKDDGDSKPQPQDAEEIFEPREENLKTTAQPVRTRKNAEGRHDLDSKGFRTYSHVVPDWNKMIADDVVNMLKRSIIYNEHDIVAINKPYGLPVHGGPSVHHHVARYLPKLAEILDPTKKLETLHMVHRIDKETTGVLLLARTAERAAQIHDLFLKRNVRKIYWVLTKGVPDPLKGIINIPIGESDFSGTHRKVLRPGPSPVTSLVRKGRRTRDDGREAITNYTVLGATKECALVELNTETGVKHQVRVHLAHGISTPVLGDHKYSHFTKLAPQKLPPSFLKAFDIRQQKVRTIPMHLHAMSVVLPEFIDGQNVHISAPLPEYFTQSMKKLRVRKNKFE
ncbi:hypothetical protein RvY_13003 [Ramazzottius varieornatus]|uniref:Pseudouridylate synthase RPUSD4, mitochondrial n=1 Tax=Ramazzottius varieornatus TaxID=947166 RepID=A0A1D1VNM8_RAMVA|nr:hypothetical protein RvY_13003 [Ramazzottius varieornatus]